jgi:hypothetical protein
MKVAQTLYPAAQQAMRKQRSAAFDTQTCSLIQLQRGFQRISKVLHEVWR